MHGSKVKSKLFMINKVGLWLVRKRVSGSEMLALEEYSSITAGSLSSLLARVPSKCDLKDAYE